MTVPAPLHPREDERIRTLRRYAILDTAPEDRFDRIARLATRQFDAPIALVSLVDDDRQWFKATCGLDAQETPRDLAFCAHAILRDEVMVVPDATADARFRNNPLVTGDLSIRFYAGAPLIASNGLPLGTFCVIDSTARDGLGEKQLSLLKDLAELVVEQIELRHAAGEVLAGVRHSEVCFRALYNTTPTMLCSLDREGRLVTLSDYFLKKLGYEREELIGHRLTELLILNTEDMGDHSAADSPFRTPAGSDFECRIATKSGEARDVLLRWAADEEEHADRLVVLNDITDRKIVEGQLLHVQKMESVGQLTGGLAHDFNNLLGVMLGNLQLVERSVRDDEKSAARVRAALTAVKKGAELTRRLLAFSRRQKLESEAVALNPLVDGMSKLIRRLIGGDIELECRLCESDPVARTDPAQLEAAILNLALNARDAMPDGGKLVISTRPVRLNEASERVGQSLPDGEYVEIAVGDDGTGIPEDKLDQVFEPFFTTKEVGKGSGLGLSMVYGFMRQTGGLATISSQEGEGTTVQLLLPIESGCQPVELPETRNSEALPEPAANRGRILVVEDQDDVRATALAMLESLGFSVIEASSGEEGLMRLADDEAIDLLFTDIVMPGMSGVTLAKAAKQLRPDMPVIFTTGYADAEVLVEAGADQGRNLISKPYELEALQQTIGAALHAE